MLVRKALLHDASNIYDLVNSLSGDGTLLKRPFAEICENIRDFTVAESDGGVFLGCGALHLYGPHLCEVRSIVVKPEAKSQGAGGSFESPHRPAFGLQFVADGVRTLEILRFFRGGPGCGQRQDFRGNFPPDFVPIPSTESTFSQAASAADASLPPSEFSARRLLVSRTHSNTAAQAAEMFKSSLSAAVKRATKSVEAPISVSAGWSSRFSVFVEQAEA